MLRSGCIRIVVYLHLALYRLSLLIKDKPHVRFGASLHVEYHESRQAQCETANRVVHRQPSEHRVGLGQRTARCTAIGVLPILSLSPTKREPWTKCPRRSMKGGKEPIRGAAIGNGSLSTKESRGVADEKQKQQQPAAGAIATESSMVRWHWRVQHLFNRRGAT
jgi:hypothetical protein